MFNQAVDDGHTWWCPWRTEAPAEPGGTMESGLFGGGLRCCRVSGTGHGQCVVGMGRVEEPSAEYGHVICQEIP